MWKEIRKEINILTILFSFFLIVDLKRLWLIGSNGGYDIRYLLGDTLVILSRWARWQLWCSNLQAEIPRVWADALGRSKPEDTAATRAFSGRLGGRDFECWNIFFLKDKGQCLVLTVILMTVFALVKMDNRKIYAEMARSQSENSLHCGCCEEWCSGSCSIPRTTWTHHGHVNSSPQAWDVGWDDGLGWTIGWTRSGEVGQWGRLRDLVGCEANSWAKWKSIKQTLRIQISIQILGMGEWFHVSVSSYISSSDPTVPIWSYLNSFWISRCWQLPMTELCSAPLVGCNFACWTVVPRVTDSCESW